MKTRKLSLLAVAGLTGFLVPHSISQVAESAKPDIGEVKQVIRDAAVKIGNQFGREHEDAHGLAERVEELLDHEPAPPKTVTTREKLAEEMRSAPVAVRFGGAEISRRLSGYEFDNQPATRRQKVLELQASKPSREALFRLWELTDDLGMKEDSARHRDALLLACREAVTSQPEDAGAHAMLADALFATRDGLQESERAAREALRRDAGHLRARYVIANLDTMRLFNEATGNDPHVPASLDDYLKRLVERRPSEADLEKLASGAAQLCAGLDGLESAAAASDLSMLLRCLATRRFIEVRLQLAVTARDPAVRSADMLYAKGSMEQHPVFRDVATLRKALRLAADNSEACAAIFLAWSHQTAVKGLLSPNKAAPGDKHQATATVLKSDNTSGQRVETEIPGFVLSMPEAEREMFEEGAGLLKSLLAAAKDREAALIHEAICRLDIHGLYGGRFQFGTRHLLDGLRLDPSRPNLLGLLYPLCQGEFEDDAMTAAVFEMQLALDPHNKRRQCAAALANSLGMHRRADELLERCLRDDPDDYLLWNQKAVFMLKRDSSDGGMSKAEAVFEKIKRLPSFEAAAINNEDRLLFVKNYILFKAMQGLWDEAVSIAESYLKEGFMPGEDGRELLKTLRELRPAK
jgi:hypothetical protein